MREGDTVTVSVVVPPNSEASVILPGRPDAIVVGSGSHSWQVDYPDTTPVPRELSLDSTLSDIIDDPRAFTMLAAAIATEDKDEAATFRKHTKWTPGRDLRESLIQADPPVVAAAEAALVALNDERR